MELVKGFITHLELDGFITKKLTLFRTYGEDVVIPVDLLYFNLIKSHNVIQFWHQFRCLLWHLCPLLPKLTLSYPQDIRLDLKLVSAIFLSKFYFSLNDSPSKTMTNVFLFHIKSSSRSRDIQIFVFPSSPLFLLL